jgi:Fibrinogen beta and gamma chains, C-terminal globular domain
MELRIELEDFEGNKKYAQFNLFQVAPEKLNYNLMVGGFTGKPEDDSLMYHNDQDFSTYDRANDKSKDTCCPCALTYGSGWWFNKYVEKVVICATHSG